MNDKIKAAANEYALASMGYPELTNLEHYGDKMMATALERAVVYGASYALKESGVEELREAAKILAKAANDLDDVYVHSDSFKTKMNALFDSADKCSASLSKSDLFFNDKNLKDGKE